MSTKFSVYSLGCRTNQAEIEHIQKQLVKNGFSSVSLDNSPQIIIINTCVVTQKAERETRKAIRCFKKNYPRAFLAIVGCAAEAKKRKLINLPRADLFLGNSEKNKLIDILKKRFSPPVSLKKRVGVRNNYLKTGRAFIKIQEGCKKKCTYCLTTILRGESKSKKEEEIIKEINNLPKKTKEVVIVGTAIDQWEKDLKIKKNLIYLLEKIDKMTNIPKISLSSLDPNILDEEFAKFWANNRRFSSFLHLSLQSGSSKVLKDMGRTIQFNKLNRVIQLIRKKKPHFVLRSDIIVGFPTETDKDFQQTVQLIKELKIAFTHIFPFSPRPGTQAFEKIKKGEWKDLQPEIKKKRSKIIQKETEKIRKKIASNLKGKILDCILLNKINDYRLGLTENSFFVKVKGKNLRQGDLVKVEINGFKNNFLFGNIIDNL